MSEARMKQMLGALDQLVAEPDAEFIARLRRLLHDEASAGEHNYEEIATSQERAGDETVVDLRDFETVSRPRRRNGWWGAVVAVAAVALVAVGLVVMSDNGDGVVTEPSTPSGVSEPSIPVAVPDVDPPSIWSRVPHDEAVFGGERPQWILGLTSAESGLVAVGITGDMFSGPSIDAAVWTSADGASWARIPHDDAIFGGEGLQQMLSVTEANSRLVAVGFERSGDDADAAVWTSDDGVNWSRVPDDEGVLGGVGFQMMNHVAAGGPGLVAVGAVGTSDGEFAAAVWTSVDGVTWDQVPHDEAVFGGAGLQVMHSVIAGGPGLVAVGGDGSSGPPGEEDAAVWTSVDGITWSRAPHDAAVFGGVEHQMMADVTVGGPGLVAVGGDGGRLDPDVAVWTSVDGIIWSRVPHDEVVFGGDRDQVMSSVVAVETGLWAVGWEGPDGGEHAVVWASVDGVTWSRLPHDEAVFGADTLHSMTSLTAVGSDLVAAGAAGTRTDFDAAVWVATTGG